MLKIVKFKIRPKRPVDELAGKWLVTLLVGTSVALVAILMRLGIPASVGGNQAVFSYPAIVIATLLYGAPAGSITASICFPFFWYFVVSRQSFVIESWSGALSLLMYILVSAGLIWAIARTRNTLERYHALNDDLAQQVDQRTAERNRLWQESREVLAIVGKDNKVRAANPAFCELVGQNSADLSKTLFENLVVDDDLVVFREAQAGRESYFVSRLKTAGEPAWVSWSSTFGEAETYLIGRDFSTEHHCGEQLRQSQKMELVGQLTGVLAHDFGNLLQPISMTLHLLKRRHVEDRRTSELIDSTQAGVDLANSLIKRLLALSRPSELDVGPQTISTIFDQVAPLLRQVIVHRSLEIRIASKLPMVRVDANQLEMALLNLVINARDATSPNGKLELTANNAGTGWVDITVADNGSGMDAQTLAHATEPFFSTKAADEGSGLGLPMVHNFSLAAGGRLSLRSSLSSGTQATITLPTVAAC